MFNNILFTTILSAMCFMGVGFAQTTDNSKTPDVVEAPRNSQCKGNIFTYNNICSITYNRGEEMSVLPYGSVITALKPELFHVSNEKQCTIYHHGSDLVIKDKRYTFMVFTGFDLDGKLLTQYIVLYDKATKNTVDLVAAGFPAYLVAQNEEWCKDMEAMGCPKEQTEKLMKSIREAAGLSK